MDMIAYIRPNPALSTRELPGQWGPGPVEAGVESKNAEAVIADKDARLKKACADFESIFIYSMLKSMRRSLPENKLFDNSHEQKVYKAMADQAMAENIAAQGGLGLGRTLYLQLKGATTEVGSDRKHHAVA